MEGEPSGKKSFAFSNPESTIYLCVCPAPYSFFMDYHQMSSKYC
jgi:hypothetical protein